MNSATVDVNIKFIDICVAISLALIVMIYKHTKLAEFLYDERLSQAAFAKLIGVSPSLVSQWLLMTTLIAAERAVEIERVTKGKLTRYDCRPDLFFESEALAS